MTIYEELKAFDGEQLQFTYDLMDGSTPYVLQTGEQLQMFAFADDGTTSLFTVSATTTQTTGRYQFVVSKTDTDKIATGTLDWYKIVLRRANGTLETVEQLSPLLKVR